MYSEQCISVTDLRRRTGKYIGNTQSEQFIFVGSKPENVLLTMNRYEELKRLEDRFYAEELDFHFVPYDNLTENEKSEYNEAIKKPNSSFIDF